MTDLSTLIQNFDEVIENENANVDQDSSENDDQTDIGKHIAHPPTTS